MGLLGRIGTSQETTAELKMGGIYPTRATVTLVSSATFNMGELYTADERKYLVTHEPTDGGDQGKWYGNIIPNGFTEEMDNDVHYMVLTASDNLPTLKLKLFTQDDGTNYGLPDGDFEQSFMWVAKEALKKTGFLLPIWVMVDVKPMIQSIGEVKSLSVGFVSGSNLVRIIDPSNTVDDILQVGMTISVSGGVNDGSGFTVASWTTSQQWDGSDFISITVIENVIDSGGFENVTMSFYTDTDISSLPDPLAVTVHDVRTYIADKDVEGNNYYEVNGSAMSAWDVLNNLAKQWNAKIYQNNGRWEIVRWNALAVDGGEYQYFIYNADGVQTGREDFGQDIVYPCKSTRFNFRPFGHSISMDRVLGAVGVNYRYKYKQEGDSLINMIKNGNLTPPLVIGAPPTSLNPATYTPEHWRRFNTSPTNYMTIDFVGLPAVPGIHPPSGIPFVRIGNVGERFYYNRYLSTASGYNISVGAGDRLKFSFWYRGRYRSLGTDAFGTTALVIDPLVIRLLVVGDDPIASRYQLVNKGGATSIGNISDATPAQLSSPVKVKSMWVHWQQHHDDYLAFEVGREILFGPGSNDNTPAIWLNYEVEMDPIPVNGSLFFEITGTGEPQLGSGYYTYSLYDPMGAYRNRQGRYSNRGGDIAGFFAAKIVDTSSEAVPLIHPYWYTNDGNYTDQIDDIEVLLGDDDSPDHVSNIYVMDGGQRRAIKSWDSWNNDFGWGALGLTLAKSVMQQYYRPWRIIDGDFVAPNIHWASRIEFEQRPGERYALLRGTLDPINNRFSGTIVQVSDAATPELPPGGNDGGSTVDPNWQPTGTIRCVRDDNGENTGDQEQLEVDMNPSSQTSGQQRWVNIGENTDACPIGEPIDFYWGASVLPIDPATLEYFPYVKDGDDYTMQFDNDGSGKYLVFLWRKSLGAVQSILDVELEETISSWVVEADTTINGYTYGVMRMAYMTGVFTGLDKTFKIN